MAAHCEWLVSHAPLSTSDLRVLDLHHSTSMSEVYWCRFSGGSILYALLFVHLSSKLCKSSSLSLYGQLRSATQSVSCPANPPSPSHLTMHLEIIRTALPLMLIFVISHQSLG